MDQICSLIFLIWEKEKILLNIDRKSCDIIFDFKFEMVIKLKFTFYQKKKVYLKSSLIPEFKLSLIRFIILNRNVEKTSVIEPI